MMDYEMFRDVFREKLMSHMPDELAGYSLRADRTGKVNETLDALHLVPPDCLPDIVACHGHAKQKAGQERHRTEPYRREKTVQIGGLLLYGRNAKRTDHERTAGTGAAAGGRVYNPY
jgi:hypothetical protein